MSIEQYIVRELKEDIKLLIKKVTEIDQKLGDVEGINKETQKGSQEYRKLAGDIEKRYQDDTFKRYEGYREWNKTHDNYKVIHSPTNTDEHGKKIDD